MNRLICAFLLFMCFGCNVGLPTKDITLQLLPATVRISVKETKSGSFIHVGSGWLHGNNHTILTAKHVVDGYDETVKINNSVSSIVRKPYYLIAVTFNNGSQFIVDNLKTSKFVDVAVLTINKNSNKSKIVPLQFATERPSIGQKILGAGFPFEYDCLLLSGTITGWHIEKNTVFEGEYLVTNAMFAPGNSGGPIVNSSGEVVGMVSWIDRRGPALSFAIPFDVIQKATKE